MKSSQNEECRYRYCTGRIMKKKIVLFFRTINSIDTKCDETMFKMKTNCEQNMTETIHIILP